MYLYASHLGGLYATDEPQEWEDLYCEACGDSDIEIGFFEDNDLDGIWETIKPYDLCCIGCKDCTDDGVCEKNCEKLLPHNFHSYGLLYVMEFLSGMNAGNNSYVYLICRNPLGEVFVNFKPSGHKFGECQNVLSSFCLKPELEEKIALSLVPPVDEVIKAPVFVKKVSINGNTYSIYECIVRDDDYEEGAASWYNDGWYGWQKSSEYLPAKGEEFIHEYLTKK